MDGRAITNLSGGAIKNQYLIIYLNIPNNFKKIQEVIVVACNLIITTATIRVKNYKLLYIEHYFTILYSFLQITHRTKTNNIILKCY